MVLFKRDTRKGRGIAMANDAVGSDLEMYECDKKSLTGETCEMFLRNLFFRLVFPTRGKFLPRASCARFSHPCRRNIIDARPSYADVFSWWMGFANVTMGA